VLDDRSEVFAHVGQRKPFREVEEDEGQAESDEQQKRG
jgi:hypothetical protein